MLGTKKIAGLLVGAALGLALCGGPAAAAEAPAKPKLVVDYWPKTPGYKGCVMLILKTSRASPDFFSRTVFVLPNADLLHGDIRGPQPTMQKARRLAWDAHEFGCWKRH